MRLSRLVAHEAKDRAEELEFKRQLEQKLGREVTEEEMYSLGSHLDAAGAGNPDQPLQYTPRESATPFADAKPPSKYLKYVVGAGILVLIIGVAGFIFLNMSERQYNRLNPFTPKPPANSFPQTVGNYNLVESPDYNKKSVFDPVANYEGRYTSSDGSWTLAYTLYMYDSEEEAKKDFEKKKGELKNNKAAQMTDESSARAASVSRSGGEMKILWLDGAQVKKIVGPNQSVSIELEGMMKNAPPTPIVLVAQDDPSKTATGESKSSVTVQQLFDDYQKDESAANRKYKDSIIMLKGTVAAVGKGSDGNPLVAFAKPGSTDPKDGLIACGFDKTQETAVAPIKIGQVVVIRGRVMGEKDGSIALIECKPVIINNKIVMQ
jgi:hypothetical protein